jgi:cytidylate kinase
MNTDHIYHLARLFKELVRKRGMSIEEVADVVDINLNVLPEMKEELDQTCKELAKRQVDLDMIKVRISSLEEEENRRRNRIVTLPPSSYRYTENRDNPAMNPFPY